jgi:hypothetical protein
MVRGVDGAEQLVHVNSSVQDDHEDNWIDEIHKSRIEAEGKDAQRKRRIH